MAKSFDWNEFFRIAGGVFFIGAGIVILGTATEILVQLLAGFLCIGIGVALIASK